jgi:amino acid adenylation domain-containing protein
VGEGQSLTYAALNARANQLAHHLQRLGVGPEVRVAMCLERSLEAVVGLLGILKAGGAYVPLDPGQPPERLAFLVADAQAPVVLTQQRFAGGFAAARARLVCLESDWGVIARESEKNTLRQATGAHLAYVMYTSGSTGTPKGVAVEHRQLCNYVRAIVARLELPAGATFAVLSTLAADLGHTTVFPSLCQGGCLHLVSQADAFDPEALAAYFRRQPVDCLKIVPSHLAALLAGSLPAHILPRQRLILGGEASGWEMVEALQALAPACRIFNHYGPTEATVGALTYPVAPGHSRHRTGQLPLGSPLANTQVYILDARLQPVPVGVPGELCIGGAGLARGYLHDGGLTAARFVPNPLSNTPGARLYKTGDRARFLPDRSIEFLGRADHQIKLRGFRVELGEVETALGQHPGVREAVVMARQDGPGTINLVAYVVPNRQPVPAVQELRRSLRERLPDHMVPAAFVFLQALPLTANGKVDRQALPAPGQTAGQPPGLFVPPRTAVEEVLAGIWTELLGREQVSVHDNFFELGGHSLLGIQVLSRVRQAFRVELPPRDLFEAPTVAGLAAALVEHEAQPGQVAAIARLRQDMARRSAEDIQALLQEKRQAHR